MRKYIRRMLRAKGERMGVKPSRYVAREFDRRQIKKYGELGRLINQAKGTHKRNTWKTRIALALDM